MGDKKKRTGSCYCINLRRANTAVTEYYDRVMASCGLTVSQFSLLNHLIKLRVCYVSELAVHVGLDRSTVVRGLKPLFEAGYIKDVSQPESRNRQLEATPSGLAVNDRAFSLWQKAQMGIEERIGAEGVKTLSKLLEALETI
ncbi:MAG: MarR family winged helix-turn-helix transcriptional regulator [Synergistaceae bacterium]|jgi:DNA-binding MarR family transcriptional regulator|nr:MarR family winged helix-turn-helix transcriptional regulator [Synergistaceae bacterium]